MNKFSDATPIASADQYRQALLAARQRMSDVQLKMLQAHCRSPGHTNCLDHLAELLSLTNFAGARTAYRNYARLIADELKFVPVSVSNKPVWLCAIAYGQPDVESNLGGDYEWVMRPELVQAMQSMKWA
jgi:hypothetical protein